VKPFAPLLCLMLLGGLGCPPLLPEQRTGQTNHEVDDAALRTTLERGAEELIEAGRTVPMNALRKQLERTHCSLDLPRASDRGLTAAGVYRQSRPSVLILGGIYKCDRCPRWHASVSCGFFITAAGAFVTNYHVMSRGSHETLVAMTHDGAVYPVAEVLAADKAADLAVLRLDAPGERFEPVPLSAKAPVGADVWVLSHPDDRFYLLTKGIVSRYFRREREERQITMMAVTADFARGSSGAPVLDERGHAVGVVSGTHSVYYRVKNGRKENLQMVLKHCVPAASVLRLIQPQ
jgi:S1-C subfamily serine protease